MHLGEFELSLNVANLKRSLEFYQRLGFTRRGGNEQQGWVLLEGSGLRLGLYQGHLASNLFSFFHPDVNRLAVELSERGAQFASGPELEADGTLGATLRDPDGNVLYLNSV